MFNVLVIKDFLNPDSCSRIVAEMRAAGGRPAAVYGTGESGAVQVGVRKTTLVEVSDVTREYIHRLILERKQSLNLHFGGEVNECEQPQFLHYYPGDYFVAHQDGNTPLIHDDTRLRKLSLIIFLNSRTGTSESFEGGELTLHGKYPDIDARLAVPNEVGTLVVFPAETTHEVRPVTAGERYTIVSWFR